MLHMDDLKRYDREQARERRITNLLIVLKESFVLVACVLACFGLLVILWGSVAHARVVREEGWQIHIYYAVPKNNRGWDTIGPPLPDRRLCEDLMFPILIERLQDRVRCVKVDEVYVRQ